MFVCVQAEAVHNFVPNPQPLQSQNVRPKAAAVAAHAQRLLAQLNGQSSHGRGFWELFETTYPGKKAADLHSNRLNN